MKIPEPILQELVSVTDPNVIRVGKLDATIYKRTAAEFKVEGYPSLKYKRGDFGWEDYEGPRTLAGFMEFVKKAEGELRPDILQGSCEPPLTAAAIHRLTCLGHFAPSVVGRDI